MTLAVRQVGPLHLRDQGGPGVPLLLTHGMAAHSRWWDRVAPLWKDIFHIAAIDFRGHGESRWAPDGDYCSATWREDIDAARRALGWDRFLLCGHSMGARIALDYAQARPERLLGLVAVDFLPEVRPDMASSRFARARGRSQPSYDSENAIVAKFRLEPDGTLLSPEELRELGRHSVRRTETGYTWKFDWRSLQYSLPPVWPQASSVATPTLLIRGASSTIMSPGDLERIAAAMPRACALEIARAHHHVPLDTPVELADAVVRWTRDAGIT